MDFDITIGLLIAFLSYITIWFLLVRSVGIIREIDKRELENIDSIKDELDI